MTHETVPQLIEGDNAFGIFDGGPAAGGSPPQEIVLLGHIDTVGGEVPVRVEDGRLYGRGAVDAKGPLAAFACAAAKVGPQPGWRIVVVGAVEEEAATSKGARYAATQYRPAFRADNNNALVRAFLAAIRGQGQQPGFVLKTGTSDMNVLGPVWRCSIVAYGPGDSSLDHTPHEHVVIDQWRRSVAVLSDTLQRLAIGELARMNSQVDSGEKRAYTRNTRGR